MYIPKLYIKLLFFKNILERSNLKKKKEKTIKTDIIAIILVSSANAEDRENKKVLLKLGFSRKFIPVYILITVNERKKMSCEL